MLNSAIACFYRIQNFLNSDARRDHRLPLISMSAGDDEQNTTTTNDHSIELQNLPFSSEPSQKQSATVLFDVQNASFSWTSNGQPVVTDVSFTLQQRKFCFIIGPVGSGKSTLLKGLLGETPSSQGFVYTTFPSTAYVDQTPWIQNATIQQNILGVSNFDETWYREVVRACALEQDIAIMPKQHGK